jgi:hypothetical protein
MPELSARTRREDPVKERTMILAARSILTHLKQFESAESG